jgi:hypothetical protein
MTRPVRKAEFPCVHGAAERPRRMTAPVRRTAPFVRSRRMLTCASQTWCPATALRRSWAFQPASGFKPILRQITA